MNENITRIVDYISKEFNATVYKTRLGYIINGDSLEILADVNFNANLFFLDPPWFDTDPATDFDSNIYTNEFTAKLREKWQLPDANKLIYVVNRNLVDNGLVYLFCYMPYILDYHNLLVKYKFKFMYELIWYKNIPAIGNGIYPLRNHVNIWAYRRGNVHVKDTHHDIRRVCRNPELKDIDLSMIKDSKYAQTLKSKIKNVNHPVVRNNVGYPKTVIQADIVNHHSEEYIGHPTQIPSQLVKFIINMACKEGDLVIDPFFGSGTTGVVCEELNINYIGIDIMTEYCHKSYERIVKFVNNLTSNANIKLSNYF